MYFDGGCGPKNPGGIATFGFHIEEDGKTTYSMYGTMDETNTSNNVAEYGGLIMGLLWLKENNKHQQSIQVMGDSKLVISQMFRHWRIKNGAYVPYAKYAKQLVSEFSDIRGKLIPRYLNSKADELTRIYSTEKIKVPSVN